MAEALNQADIARKLGVSRNYVNQLSQKPDFPRPAEPMRWDLADVRRFLRGRALAKRAAGAVICATCGGDLS